MPNKPSLTEEQQEILKEHLDDFPSSILQMEEFENIHSKRTIRYYQNKLGRE